MSSMACRACPARLMQSSPKFASSTTLESLGVTAGFLCPRHARFEACETLASTLAVSISEATDRSNGERESPDTW